MKLPLYTAINRVYTAVSLFNFYYTGWYKALFLGIYRITVKIAAFGTVEDIMNAELLTDIFETKINIIDGPYGPLAVY